THRRHHLKHHHIHHPLHHLHSQPPHQIRMHRRSEPKRLHLPHLATTTTQRMPPLGHRHPIALHHNPPTHLPMPQQIPHQLLGRPRRRRPNLRTPHLPQRIRRPRITSQQPAPPHISYQPIRQPPPPRRPQPRPKPEIRSHQQVIHP